eukprot:PhM_4_TR8435/c1_g7_i5/m.4109
MRWPSRHVRSVSTAVNRPSSAQRRSILGADYREDHTIPEGAAVVFTSGRGSLRRQPEPRHRAPAAGSWTQITTDCWRTNIALRSRFRLRQVNHRHYFVDPQTGIHTNTIESMNGF